MRARGPGARRAQAGRAGAPCGREDPRSCARGGPGRRARRAVRPAPPRRLLRALAAGARGAGGRAWRTAPGGRVYLGAGTRAAGRPRRPCRPRGPPCRPPFPGPERRACGPGSRRPQPSECRPGRSAGKWREKGLFRVARRAVGLAGPRRRPAGRSWFRFRSQPAARVNFLNLAPGGGDPSPGA